MTEPHSNIIFAKPRHEYASYRDLYALIDLSGFPTCHIDEIDPQSDNAYIITILNGELPDGGYPNARASIYLLDLEYHLDGIPPLANVSLLAGDKWYADKIGARYTPIGSHPDLRPSTDSAWHSRYDVAFLGYINGVHRREHIRQQLIERGVSVSPTGAWGDERHRILSNSAAYLHVHQHDHAPTIAPLRMVVAAAYGLPVITEDCIKYGKFESYVLSTGYSQLADCVQLWAKEHMRNGALEYGQRLHQLLCHELTFRRSVESAL